MTNSRLWLIWVWEYREGRMETETMGGSELTVPAQATVIKLAWSQPSPGKPQQDTSTTGTGASKVEGFSSTLGEKNKLRLWCVQIRVLIHRASLSYAKHFVIEQIGFQIDAPGKTHQAAILTNYPVAGNHHRQWIGSTR